MAALKNSIGLYNVDCPACGESLPVLVRTVPSGRTIEFEVDTKPVQDHVGQHLEAA